MLIRCRKKLYECAPVFLTLFYGFLGLEFKYTNVKLVEFYIFEFLGSFCW